MKKNSACPFLLKKKKNSGDVNTAMRERDHQQFLDFICIIELKNNVWHIPNEEL